MNTTFRKETEEAWGGELAITELLQGLGFDLSSENFKETPDRVMRFWREFTQREEPILKDFESCCLDAISLTDYNTWGLCPHHLLPVNYMISISYVPNGRVLGISKLPRIADYILRTLPLQEDLPKLIIDFLREKINPKAIQCSVKGTHLCMIMRGVKAKDCTLITSASWFQEDV